jgi:Flp pilus assembly protein TadD
MTAWAREVTATASPAAVAAPSTPALNHFKEAERAYQEGLAAYQANRTEASLVALQLALGFYPGHLPARELLADQLELHGDTSAALALLADGLAIAPDHSAFRKRAARLFADRGELAKAAQVLVGPGLAPVRTDPELHRLLAATYRQLGEHFLAAQTYRNLLVHDRRNGTLWVNLGGALDANGQRDEARQAYQKALTVGGLDREGYAQARAGVNM